MIRNRPLRVAHVIHDLGPGGAEHVLADLAVAAAGRFEVSVVSLLPLGEHSYPARLAAHGVPVVSAELAAWWDPRGPARMRVIVGELAPDVVHTHLKHADVIGGRTAARLGLPHVATLHVIEEEVGLLGSVKRRVATRSRIRTAVRTIAVSEAQREWYLESARKIDPSRVVTIHNGIPDPRGRAYRDLSETRLGYGIPADAVVVAMVAVMRPEKGHEVVIEAWRRLAGADLVLVMAGDGPERDRLEQIAASDGRIRFVGFVDDVSDLLSAADIAVHASYSDALPTAVIHALAAGLPVVAADVGGVPEMVGDDNGTLVPAGDSDAMARALLGLGRDPAARRLKGKRSRERFENEFSAARWVDRLEALYQQVITA